MKQTVLIVGAGMAGLSCAVHLHKAGVKVCVLEADCQVGGRVQTDTVNGFLLDRGFQVYLDAYPETAKLIRHIIRESQIPVVVDADGINNLAGHEQILKSARVPIVLTPHPGEMARLLGESVSKIQEDRINSARNVAVDLDVHLVLKGARTVIAHPDGRIFINATGNAGMASGGMGDVLTGIIAGLIVQGFTPESAAHIGVYLHGAAADSLAQSIGPYGYLAGEVMRAIPGEIGKILDGD